MRLPQGIVLVPFRILSLRLTLMGALVIVLHYLMSHLEQTPITERWRFVYFTANQMNRLQAGLELEVLCNRNRHVNCTYNSSLLPLLALT